MLGTSKQHFQATFTVNETAVLQITPFEFCTGDGLWQGEKYTTSGNPNLFLVNSHELDSGAAVKAKYENSIFSNSSDEGAAKADGFTFDVSAKLAKHIPEISASDIDGEYHLTVGTVPHPVSEAHYIKQVPAFNQSLCGHTRRQHAFVPTSTHTAQQWVADRACC